MTDPIIQRIEDFRCRRGRLAAERRNRGYTLYRAASGVPVARLRPTRRDDRVEVLHQSLWKERWTSAGPFGRTILPIVDAMRFIASEDIFWAVRQPPAKPKMRKVELTGYAGADTELAVSGAMSGAFSLLRKPTSEVDLADRIHSLLAARETWQRKLATQPRSLHGRCILSPRPGIAGPARTGTVQDGHRPWRSHPARSRARRHHWLGRGRPQAPSACGRWHHSRRQAPIVFFGGTTRRTGRGAATSPIGYIMRG